MLLLQITESYSNALTGRLGDQMFSIVLLVGFAILMLRKHTSLEKRLEKYMDDDREKMQNVIENNTKALEHFYDRLSRLPLVLILFMCFLGCASVKKKSSFEKVSEQSIQNEAKTSSSYNSSKTQTVKKDTIVGIPSKVLSTKLLQEDLFPVVNHKGDTISNKKTIKGKGVHIDVSANKDGSVDVTAHCDSITMLLAGMIQEQKENDSMHALEQAEFRYNQSLQIKEVSSKTKRFGWLFFTIGTGVGAVAAWFTLSLLGSSFLIKFKRF